MTLKGTGMFFDGVGVEVHFSGRATVHGPDTLKVQTQEGEFVVPKSACKVIVPTQPAHGSVVVNQYGHALARRSVSAGAPHLAQTNCWYYVDRSLGDEIGYTWEHIVKVMGVRAIVHRGPNAD